jgi:uncharacterized membrane-anchored protein
MRSKLSLFGLVLILLSVNLAILARERRLAHSRTAILQLAPADPRSLMQGDYMDLRYALASQAKQSWPQEGTSYLTLDSRQVGTALTLSSSPGSLPLRYRMRDGRALFGAESYFFQEGQGAWFSQARYGELKVDEQGYATLIALLDKDLHPIRP